MSIVLGVALGVVVVALFLGSTPVVLGPLVRRSPKASPATALLFFGTKAVASTVALVLLLDVGGVADHVHLTAFGITVAVTALTWSAVLVWRFRNSRVPTYDPGYDKP